MTSIRSTRTLKSGIAAAVSFSLFFTSAGWPASQAFAQVMGAASAGSEAGVQVRVAPVSLSGNAGSVPALSLGAAALNPGLTAAPSAFAPSASAAALPASAARSAAAAPSAAALRAIPAASAPERSESAAPSAPAATPASPAGSEAAPASKPNGDSGPRWVESDPSKGGPVSGPRWVAPAKDGVSGWIGRQLARWSTGGIVAGHEFDGEGEHSALHSHDAPVTGAASTRSSALAKPSDEAARIINDSSIPTPEAARLVGEIHRHEATPLWVKIVAPLSVIAAGVVAFHFGAVGVLTLGAGLVVSVLAHEVAHLAVLKALGDHTAEHAGTHSLNPFHHIDAVKTVIVPALTLALSTAVLGFPILIGSGKAVDADFNNLRGPLGGPRSARNAFWVAAAGPLTNFAIAALAFAAVGFLPAGGLLAGVAIGLAHMNVALGVFNLLPLPQLDGGKILASVLPEAWYAKWVYNPNVEKGYQGLFRRLYEGPTNLLTFIADKLGVRDQRTLNRVANVVTFGALAAFYAVAYIHFAVAIPLLFLALPCTYDYWCIREKVRSEAAVKDVMDIFSQWSSVIAQIAEDRGMASEVSLFETEHAMKNALETLVDEMMAQESFRALSEDEKIAALMAKYPDRAADFLKEKVFTEGADTKEKILEMLRDPRNEPFYDRLKKWFSDHEIFQRWDNPAYEGKLRDQMKQAEKPKSQGQGGSTTLGMLGFMALLGGGSLLFPGLAHHAPTLAAGGLALAGMIGSLAPRSAVWKTKVQPRPGDSSNDIRVRFGPNISVAGARNALLSYPGARQENAGQRIVFRVPATSAETAAEIARDLAEQGVVDMVSVPNAIYTRLMGHGSTPAAAGSDEEGTSEPQATNPAEVPHEQTASEIPAPAPEAAPEPAAPAPTPEELIAAAAQAKDERPWAPKISVAVAAAGEAAIDSSEIRVTLAAGLSEELVAKIKEDLGAMNHVTRVSAREDGTLSLGMRWDNDDYADMARNVAQLKAVEKVATSAVVRDRLFATSLPAKIASHGKEHWSTGTVLVRFNGDVAESQIKEILGKNGQKTIFRQGDAYAVVTLNAEKAAEKAKDLAADEHVAAVEVHANVAAALENRTIKPYPDAESYEPAQGVLVQFKAGTTADQMKAYAEARRLRLVYPQFRGGQDLALMEVLNHGDAAVTRQMLSDETLDEGSIATEIKPFKEQPGDAPLAPSAAAVARAQARKAAAEAAEQAAAHTPRRDVAAEWISYLQTRKLADGTTLKDEQVQLMAEFLKPVAKGPGESRPPVVARTEEVKRMLPIVTSPRGMRNSVILVGGAGTGKTAVAEGLAEMIEDAEHASSNDAEQFLQFQRLKGRWLVEMDINKILSSEDPVKVLNALLSFLPRFNDANPGRGNEVIVLMDEIQKFFLDNNGQKIANVLKGPLRDGKISVIATTTDTEYKKFIESDDAFRRRFEKIDVAEPNVDQTTRILRAMKGWLTKIHNAIIPDAALVAAAKLTDQFDKTNFNPDKSIKAVQDGAELSRPENLRAAVTLDIRETWNDLTVAVNEARQLLIDKGIASTLALPVEMYNKIADLIKKAESLYAEREAIADGEGRLTVDVVKRVIAQKTGIASGQLNMGEEDAARYNDMEKTIGQRVINQDPALTAIANAIRRNKAGLSNPNRPMGKFLLTGPTGVGKTYLAKELARFLFNDPNAMIRMDMSEYMEEHTAQRLTGSPPGYVGYGEGGQLTEAVRKKPYSVILFDEVEKAHPKVFDVLLQILDDGRLTDGQGRTIDFKNTVILMTSNAGMGAVDGEKYAKLLDMINEHNLSVEQRAAQTAEVEKAWDAEIDASVAEHLKASFRPEFLNRLDEDPRSKNKWIRVNRLRAQDTKKIAEIQVGEFKSLLADRHETDLIVDPSVIEFLSKEGFSHLYGARPMTAAIEKHIVDPMAKWILDEAAKGHTNVRGGQITVSYDGSQIVFKAEIKPIKDIARVSFEDASKRMAAEVFSLIEGLAGEGDGEEPSEGLFDKFLRAARPAPGGQAKAEAPSAPRAFFAPDAPLSMPDAASVAALSDKPATTAALKSATEAASAAGWPEATVAALTVPAGQVGEGWLKQIVAFAKDRSKKAGTAAPVELVSSVDGERARFVVHLDAELSDADRAFLAAHFTGTPPASFEAAQRAVDNMNLNGGMVRNHYLLDLYRRLKDVPGARMGYVSGASARGGKGADVWLEIRKEEPKPVEAPALAKSAAAADGVATPHQSREMAKVRDLMMRFIDQSRIGTNEQDGTAIKVAAAEGFARLATPADAAAARQWIADNKWATPGALQMTITSKNAWAMTAALVLKRFGGTEDIALLEAMSAKLDDYSHYQVPLHNAIVDALGTLYAQAGLTEVRAAAVRAANLKGVDDNARDMKEAIGRALGRLGYPADMDAIKGDGQGIAELYRRMGKGDELRAAFYDDALWNKTDSHAKIATFALLAEAQPTEQTFELLAQSLKGKRSADRVARYYAAQSWADLVAKTGRTKGLADAMATYTKIHGINSYEEQYAVLYAYVLAAEQAGGADVLAPLEALMSFNPGSIASNHEQMYFSTPEAWAKALIRGGKFAEYSQPTLGANGAPEPSRLQKMLIDKDHPMMAAAALRAIALARDPSFKPKAAAAAGDVPRIDPGVKGSSGGYGGYGGGYPYGQRHDYLMRRFEGGLTPP
jgi:ATP-dependent Clp protease ATP-binding subunit ClpC